MTRVVCWPLIVLLASTAISAMGCSKPQPSEKPASAPASSQPQPGQPAQYDLKGKVIAVDKPTKRLTVDHEAIPAFMAAMTMAYPVKDEHLLDNLAPGDQVTAKVMSSGSEYWLENIVVTKAATAK